MQRGRGRGAGSAVFAADIWSALLARDPLSADAGARLRAALYAPGGTLAPAVLLARLLGTADCSNTYMYTHSHVGWAAH
jgi:Zn-dependent oligopeptidase